MKVIFCRTRHVYDSYADFWRLVSLSGYRTIFIDKLLLRDLQDPQTAYVFTPWNGEVTPILEQAKNRASKLIWWLLERDVCDRGITAEFDRMASLVDQVWVSDRSYADVDPRLAYTFLGGHPDFGTARETTFECKYDVCTLAYLWGRRQHIVDLLLQRNISVAPPAYGKDAQDIIVPQSRIMLNMHQYDNARIIAPMRFAVAAAYGLPILTETVDDPFPLIDGEDFVSSSYDSLPDAIESLLKDSQKQLMLSANLQRKILGEWRFDRAIERAIGKISNEQSEQSP